jgi:hypothetical protein
MKEDDLMDWSWLIYLMCPLMMIPMLFMMLKGNHGDQGKHNHQKHLIEELNQLKSQNEIIQNELRDLKNNS